MNPTRRFLRRFLEDERGQMFPWMVLMSGLFLGVAGITVDLGHAWVCYTQLKASTDAAVLAGATALAEPNATTASVSSAIQLYASKLGGANLNANLQNVALTGPTFKCITNSPMVLSPCGASPTGYNVVQIEQTATVPTFFIKMLSLYKLSPLQSLTMHATSTASMASGRNDLVNVAVVLDTTASMGSSDSSCKATRIKCALNGVQNLLNLLEPCTAATSKAGTTCTAYDSVSLFTFPNFQAKTASNDTTCPSSNPAIVPYSLPTPGATWSAPTGTSATYQITDYLSDWTSNNQPGGPFNQSSALAIATGAGKCAGVQTPGGDGTYYAGAIYAAQSSLMAQQAGNPGSKNIMIVLSDGDANAASNKMAGNLGNAGNTYGSVQDQCNQAITAAKYAQNQGTTVYTIAYGSPSSGCSTDTGSNAISPCNALMQMSSGYVSTMNAPDFFSDSNAQQNKGQCVSASNPNLDLDGIFGAIAVQLTKVRLLPNNIS